ncbi:MAG TPA: hypothetical protein VNO31_26745, partial [Umezawaea sp.]|nr:hypothetical protein [Umezawaea sp.]
MTERQDLRPLSTEDLLPEHDRDRTTHADDQYRADGYQDSAVDRTDDTTGTTDQYDDGFRESATGRVDETDADRQVVSDEYDDT